MKTTSLSLLCLLALLIATATVANAGSVARLIYDGVTGSTVASLTNAAIFPNGPTFREQLDDFTPDPLGAPVFGLQGKDNSFVDFGSWIRGYLEAPADGNYTFFVGSDDASELWLSTNYLASNTVRIALESGSGAPLFSGARLTERSSVPIALKRGAKYYFEVRHKQDSGSSYIQVGWKRPDGVQEVIPALHLAQHPLDAYEGRTDANAAPFFNASGFNGGNLPAAANVNELGTVLLQADVIAAQPTSFQWLSNGVPIPGENLSFLRWSGVPYSANGASIQFVVSNQFGILSSAATSISVTPDAAPLGIDVVDHRGNPNGLRVTFSKAVRPATATNLANYGLSAAGGGSLAIQSAILLSDQVSVQLSGNFNFQVGGQYVLTIQNVQDTAAVPNGLSPNPTNVFFTYAGENLGPVGFAANSPLADLSVTENRTAHLEVIPTGATPYLIQWLHNGAAIAGATNLTLDLVGTFSAAGTYQVVVSNEFSYATSVTAHLTVTADTVPPQVVEIRGLAGELNEVRLKFDELLEPLAAENPAHYTLGLVPVLSARLEGDGKTVTLSTGNLIRDQIYLLTISGLKDRAATPNVLNTTGSFIARVNYRGEVLADGPVRYFPFEETNGSSTVASLVSVRDALTNTVSALIGSPVLGASGLLPAEPENTAIQFSAAGSQRISVPNGSDLNATAGPWAKKSIEFWFRAASVPAPGTTGLGATAGLWEQGAANRGLAVYLWRDPSNPNPEQSTLIFHACNNLSDGAGSPFGATANLTVPAIYAQAPVLTGQLYHVVAVFDGDSAGTNGNLILYLNGVEVSRAAGAGQIYNHTGDIQIGHGNALIHTGQSGNFGYFDGVIDEVTAYNRALPANRVAVHYGAGTIGSDAAPAGFVVSRVETRGNPNQLLVTFSRTVAPQTANAVANFSLRSASGTVIPISSASLLAGDRTVWLTGSFGFQAGSNYVLSVSNTSDQQNPANPLQTNPTNIAFSFSAPGAVVYDFNSGVPPEVEILGNAGVVGSGSFDDSGYLRLTNATNNQSGYVLFTERRDVDQFHLRFKARLSDTSPLPADGFSITLAADLPLATFGTAEEGYLPTVSQGADRLIVAFDNYASNSGDPSPSVAVKWRGVTLTNILTGTNGIPALHNNSGAWVDVDIRLERGGKLTVVYDGVTVVNKLPTGIDVVRDAQLGIAARTGGSYETHWFDNISLSYTEGDLGPVGISSESELGTLIARENQLVRFAVVPTGAGPFSYQWYREGTPVNGGNERVLYLTATTNITGHYYAIVRNEFSQVTSPSGTLSVDTDNTAPAVQRILALGGSLNEIRISFSEPVDPSTATNVANYAVGNLSLLSATISADGRTVTLKTGPQVFQQGYTLAINGVKDRSASGNVLTGQTGFASTVSYPDEVLADQPVRYWRFSETNGVSAVSLVSVLDVLATTSGALVNTPLLGQASLVPNTAGDGAIRLRSASSQRITIPNGSDLNTTVGPWEKKTVEFWFNAASVPAPGTTGFNAAAGLFEEGGGNRGLAAYLWRDPANSNPAQAELVFHAWNNLSDGAGTPFGAPGTPAYVRTTISTGVTYHVVAVLDGSTNLSSGATILYVNGVEAARVSNAGRIYNHTSDIQIGRGNTILHTATNTTAGNLAFFDGTIDEVALYNTALSAGRAAAHYQIGATSVTAPVIDSIRLENGSLVIRWQGSGRLQHSSSATGPFGDVPASASPYQVPFNNEPAGFYRLVR